MRERVGNVCNRELWDKEWFIRGITKNGKKIGTSEDAEGKVHLESNDGQCFPVQPMWKRKACDGFRG